MSLIVKVFLLFISRTNFKFGVFTALLGVCTLVSFVEFVGITTHILGGDMEVFLRIWYLLTTWCFCFALIFAIQVTESSRLIIYMAILLASLISPLFYTDLILSGYTANDGFLTAIKADYYVLFSAYVILAIVLSICGLMVQIIKTKSDVLLQSIRASYVLLAFIAPFVVAILVISLQYFGFKLNAFALTSIASMFMFIFLVRHQNDHLLFDIKAYLPWSAENKLSRHVIDVTQRRFRGEITLKESMDEIEKAQLEYTLGLTKGNKYQAAKHIGASKATFYTKLSKHGISTKV